MVGAAWLLARAAPGSTGELAASLVLFQPRTLFVLEQTWSEPLVLFCFALAVYAISRAAHRALTGAALGLLAASKQYSPFLLVPLAFAMQERRGLWVAAAVLAAVLGPFFIRDPAGLLRGVVEFQFLQPFRPDSLSLTALAVRLVGPAVLPVAVAGRVLGVGAIAFCLLGRPGVPLGCAAAAAARAAGLRRGKQP